MDHLKVIVVEGFCLLSLADDLLLDLQLAHAHREYNGGNNAFFVEDLALSLVEWKPVEDPAFVAVEERSSLLEESDDCFIGKALACLYLVHDSSDI